MASIKLKPWSFDERTVKLHWFGHIRLTSSNAWRITVAFEDQQKVALVDYPIGLLPILRIGQYYQNGRPLATQKDGMIYTVNIDNLSKGKTEQSLDICRQFGYFLYGKAELITQKMWSFYSNGVRYHIPQVELIRALYVKNKLLANVLLRPNGMEYLLNDSDISEKSASFHFSREIPASLINEEFVQHFAWLYLVQDIKNSFESIQTNVYAKSTEYGLSYGQPLELIIPNLPNSNWTFRGKRIGNDIMIYELLSFTGAELPLDRIEYSHVSIKKRNYTDLPNKKQISSMGKEQNFEIETNQDKHAKEDTHQPVVDQEATQMKFVNRPKIERIAKYEQEIHQGDTYITKEGRGGAITTSSSVNESISGGQAQPVDFKTLEVTNEKDGYGLDQFFEMIKCFEEMYPELHITMSIVNLPIGRTFSWLPDGRRRICAVVSIRRKGEKPIHILEIARPDQRSLSTLIVILNKKGNRKKEEEEQIQQLLAGLVFNSGNWRKYQLNKLSHVKLKHTSKSPEQWAERVIAKVSYLEQS
ncbi:Tn7-like element transposition protein TnsE [Aquibacillus sp. 3ASR75-11]|uniref:Tn7-like element transposition protein TnsE n=1 Tax=Terrihalobacillus insolitus TaxID=2950438 RepID=A0A9X3WQP7_9BACI|nr:Tn7-like element transposition protein TnsE [Terrihalobacillus insolitus]MDC3424332.1 Tn7-like element transposition protein TnsE [Terrihalobacillus insolitus]